MHACVRASARGVGGRGAGGGELLLFINSDSTEYVFFLMVSLFLFVLHIQNKNKQTNKTKNGTYYIHTIIIIMEICKAPTLRLKALNKHTHIMYIEMENVIQKKKYVYIHIYFLDIYIYRQVFKHNYAKDIHQR